MLRVISYIDGFNLYYGMKSKGWRRFFWLDVVRLSEKLLIPGQVLATVKYFTAIVSSTPRQPDKSKRQKLYLEALENYCSPQIYYGHYLLKDFQCRRCGSRWKVPEEKMTDVNIATELLTDAFANAYDVAMVLSADSDLTGPIIKIRENFPTKRIVVAFPPDRHSKRLKQVAHAAIAVGRATLAKSQLPEVVKKRGTDIELKRPDSWR